MASPRLRFLLVTLALPACNAAPGGTTPDDAAACESDRCGGCTSDGDCRAPTPRCDSARGECVPCLPQADNCPAGHTCVARDGSYLCADACRTAVDCPALDSGGATACCSALCVDTDSDPDNCGACQACAPAAHATTVCRLGRCAVGQCHAGFSDCNRLAADGCESATDSDPGNCGACGIVCPTVRNGAAGCQAGQCRRLCNLGFLHCSLDPADGCEVDIATDPRNCGGCGHGCQNLGHAAATCAQGLCVLGACDAGWADCNRNPADGCETNVDADAASCGACGKVCSVANASATCQGGKCAVGMCRSGFADCNGHAGDGCEVTTSSDVNNCGGCGHACLAPNGTPGCSNAVCVVAGCSAGFADCDGQVANGCEVALAVSVDNCGACGRRCAAPANATAGCQGGACGIGMCDGGFADCDAMAADGCEARLDSPLSCGACNVVCPAPPHASARCSGGACGIGVCQGHWSNCNALAVDGCEVDLASDPSNCGGCGQACITANATPGCSNLQCTIAACNPGYADCNGSAADGCEVNTDSDRDNCGRCGRKCDGKAPICRQGVCHKG